MKNSISHLPDHIQQQLKTLTEIIRLEAEPEMIVLFGSYTGNRYVESDVYTDPEDGITYEYRSDFDILVVTRTGKQQQEYNKWTHIERLIDRAGIETPVCMIVHNIREINREISNANYFFCDIQREGIVLYDSGNFELQKRKPLSPEGRVKKAKDEFALWYTTGVESFVLFRDSLEKGFYRWAAFMLHQSAECFFSCIILVFTQYKPKSHRLKQLNQFAAEFDPRLLGVFPRKTITERARHKLLLDGYIKARFTKDYEITREDLEYLAGRVEKLRDVTMEICRRRIEEMEDGR